MVFQPKALNLIVRITHHKPFPKTCVIPTADRNNVIGLNMGLVYAGVEITEQFSRGKVKKNLPVNLYFGLSETVSHKRTSGNRQCFNLSFRKVPRIFACLPLLLPVLDRQTVSNFHPCERGRECPVKASSGRGRCIADASPPFT